MDTTRLKKFAQAARLQLMQTVAEKLEHVLKIDSALMREKEQELKTLKNRLKGKSSHEREEKKKEIIRQVAYTWFNRLCALRFMDVNRYTQVRAVSPPENFTFPEILIEAQQGHIDEHLEPYLDKQKVFDILAGRVSSPEPQQEAYRILLVAVCNYYHRLMPFLFEPIRDYTELLLPDDLLSPNSILADVRDALTAENCGDVEVIGWLYQYYISQEKDRVFAGLRKNIKISSHNIPAATQLFTPHWIVRFIVENSLGHLWMLNRPHSRIIDQMPYYIRPRQTEDQFLTLPSPEEIKICDPACGSGHILVYAFDLLYEMYREEAYDPADIPRLILENNLYGIEIDPRAGELAAFALVMKARQKDRRFFKQPVKPNICVLENIAIEPEHLDRYIHETGVGDVFTPKVREMLKQWEAATNFGSLIKPCIPNAGHIYYTLEKKTIPGDLFLRQTHRDILKALEQAGYLSSQYNIVIANPPYMGNRGMNDQLRKFALEHYPNNKLDLFSMFIHRNITLTVPNGMLGFMSPYVWMFSEMYKKLRLQLLHHSTVTSLVQLEYNSFDAASVPICAFTLKNVHEPGYEGGYIRLSDFRGVPLQGPKTMEAVENPGCGWFYRVSARQFDKMPGSPIAYWVSHRVREIFEKFPPLSDYADTRNGLNTGDNDRFLKMWYEPGFRQIGLGYTNLEGTLDSPHKWYPYNKGGSFRKWYGNNQFVVDWAENGKEIKQYARQKNDGRHWSRFLKNLKFMLKPGITWSTIGGSLFGARHSGAGSLFDSTGSSIFPHDNDSYYLLGFLCAKPAAQFLSIINPTANILPSTLNKIPFIPEIHEKERIRNASKRAIHIARNDWDSYETSWNFTHLPLLREEFRRDTLENTYAALRKHWKYMTMEMIHLEEENNRVFIDIYRLRDEFSPDVSLREITLTCNPHYRYGNHKKPDKLESLLLTDTVKEFIDYAVGCMFGRYSLDKPGLILANQGEDVEEDYKKQIPNPTFEPDDDNVIPILEGDWFTDNIAERFRKFLEITFGKEYYQENLDFIQKALGKTVQNYFLKDFYNHHIRRYKRRPIYWLFSSPKGSFNALIYMHRYRPNTVSDILHHYLREYLNKLGARIKHLKNTGDSSTGNPERRALKEINSLSKIITELKDWKEQVLLPLAERNIQINLDDGVKVNYRKFGKALKAIPQLKP